MKKLLKKHSTPVVNEDMEDAVIEQDGKTVEELTILAVATAKKLRRAMTKREEIDIDIDSFKESLEMFNQRILKAGGVPVGLE